MIAGLIEGNLRADPGRRRLLEGSPRKVTISARDIDAHVGLTIGDGRAVIQDGRHQESHLWIVADSDTLVDLPNAPLIGGFPSLADPIGRATVAKLFTGRMKIRGMTRPGLLSRVQRLLSVAG